MTADAHHSGKTPEVFLEWIETHLFRSPGFSESPKAGEAGDADDIGNDDWRGEIRGICGDTMEIRLKIEGGVITDARGATDGCFSSQVCGAAAAFLAKGETLMDALAISPRGIMDLLELVPGVEVHCSILAVSTLFRAIAEYLMKNDRGHQRRMEAHDSD